MVPTTGSVINKTQFHNLRSLTSESLRVPVKCDLCNSNHTWGRCPQNSEHKSLQRLEPYGLALQEATPLLSVRKGRSIEWLYSLESHRYRMYQRTGMFHSNKKQLVARFKLTGCHHYWKDGGRCLRRWRHGRRTWYTCSIRPRYSGQRIYTCMAGADACELLKQVSDFIIETNSTLDELVLDNQSSPELTKVYTAEVGAEKLYGSPITLQD